MSVSAMLNKEVRRVLYGDFFAYAREREAIRVRKEAGQTGPLTADYILQTYRFCNVFREDDATTRWFAAQVRDKVPPDQVLLATVLFRWFNRVSTADAIFMQLDIDGATAWESMVRTEGSDASFNRMRHAIIAMVGKKGPFVTGSYIIQGWEGMNKLDGVLRCVKEFVRTDKALDHKDSDRSWSMNHVKVTDYCLRNPGHVTLEEVHGWLMQFPYMGGFMAYEVVTDLHHTALLRNAPDGDTWAHAGPGATRGLNRIHMRMLTGRIPQRDMKNEMLDLLTASRDRKLWPFKRPWDMRTVEHTLCEFDKYERTRLGQGRPRQKYRGG